MSLYDLLRPVARALLRAGARLEVTGVENIPATGPFLLLCNHQSATDPILAQAYCPRRVHTMTKSTQFGHPVFRWLIPRLHGFPTRRYRVDPQAVRVALRRLAEGEGVGVYAEGERTWDGRLQPLRSGTVRLALKAGVPVVPCGITGSYDLWPRWSRRPRRARVAVRYGPPIRWDSHDRKPDREAALPDAIRRLREALEVLVEEPEGGVAPDLEWLHSHFT